MVRGVGLWVSCSLLFLGFELFQKVIVVGLQSV